MFAVLYDLHKCTLFIANHVEPQKSGNMRAGIQFPKSSLFLLTEPVLERGKYVVLRSTYSEQYGEVQGSCLSSSQFKNFPLVFTQFAYSHWPGLCYVRSKAVNNRL